MKPELRIDAFGVVGILVVSGLGYLGGIQPIVASHAEAVVLRTRVATTESALRDAEQREAELVEAIARVDAELSSGVLIADLSAATNARLARLAELADISGVDLQTVRPGERVAAERFHSMPIRMVGIGQLTDTVAFLSKLKAVFPDFGVQRFAIQRGDDGTATITIDCTWFTAQNDRNGSDAGAD